MAVPAILSDAPVTQYQVAGPPLSDGQNLYVPSVDYSNPTTGNNSVTAAKLHITKSANGGALWGEQDAAHAPSVYNTISAVYGSPATPPFFVIDTIRYFPVVPGYTGPQVIPFVTAAGSVDPITMFDTGNDTLQINLLEYGYLIQGVTLVVDGIWGNPSDPRSIAPALAAALNAQLIALSISPSVISIGVGPGSVPFNHVGFSEAFDSSSMVVLTSFTGANWSLAVTGNMVNTPYDPAVSGRTPIHIWDTTPASAGTIYTVYGINGNLNPIPLCFNQAIPATISNHVIYIPYIAEDSTLTIGRYNTLTDLWMAPISGGPALTMIVTDSTLGSLLNGSLFAAIRVRSTGALVIAYAVGSEVGSTANQHHTYWVVYSGGAWGSPALVTNSYTNTPCGSVIDYSDNVVFFLNTGPGGVNKFIATFIVKSDNSTVAITAVDSAPTTNAAVALLQGNLLAGLVGAYFFAGRVVLAIGYARPSDTTYSHAYMLEIAMSSLLASGSWTKFSTPDYVDGSNQYGGAVDVTFWNSQFQLILSQSAAAGSDAFGTLWNSDIALATGNGTGGGADTSWGASAAIFSYAAVSGVLNRIIFSSTAVVLQSSGNLGVLYSYISFVPQPTNYFTRFVVFGALTASCNSPSSGSVGGPYAHTFTASGGTPPYRWSVVSGSLPTGLTLNATSGILSGIPTATGTFSFGLQVEDFNGNFASISCSIVVSGPFTASCGTITGGSTVGTSFTQTLAVSGGESAYTWSLLMGALPAGTALNASTGVISGTLTTPGRYFYTVKVTDSTGNFAFVSCFVQICPSS